jgi:penicillin-binding protein 2
VPLGVLVRDESRRVYPYGSAAAHVLGYMTEVTEEQLATLKDQGFIPGDKIGAAGLEGKQNDLLSGVRGALLATVTPDGSIGERIAEREAIPGKDIYLSIDIDVQLKAEQQLGDRVGSIVAMNPQDNSVLAIASYPRFDPNAMYRGLTEEEANALFNDPNLPFLDRALQLDYEPGSTFKVVTGIAGLERGGFTPSDRFHCVPEWKVLGEEFVQKNWQDVDRGWLTVSEGLMASCNPVFYDIGVRLDGIDPDILPEVARQMGFGSPTGIGLDEVTGLVPDAAYKDEVFDDYWYTGDTVNMSIGQGFMQATPMQIVNAYSAIAYSGVLRKPLLIRAIGDQGGAAVQNFEAEVINPLPASQSTLDAIRYGLRLVTQSPGGTAYPVWASSSVDSAGKSGTAEDIAYERDHVFFVAYANTTEPSILAIGALETGVSGSREVGPMIRQILEAYINGGSAVAAQ